MQCSISRPNLAAVCQYFALYSRVLQLTPDVVARAVPLEMATSSEALLATDSVRQHSYFIRFFS